MTLLLLLLTIGLVAVFSLVTLLVVNALTRPLLKLASASKRLADGDYNVELDYNGKDEVGTLTQSFCQMRDHLKLYIKDLNSRAYTDAMTSVKNKGAYDIFVSRLNNEFFGEARETEPEFAVVMFDCNNLKHINDEYGHDHGDAQQRVVRRVIESDLRHGFCLPRYSGRPKAAPAGPVPLFPEPCSLSPVP